MNNKEYGDLVNSGNYPKNVQVPIDKPFVDDRGFIQNLWLSGSGSVTLIESKKGSVRAQHYHTGDWHSSYVIRGKIKYTEAEIDGSNRREFVFGSGDMFFSPPMKLHRMDFLEDTLFLTINGISKSHLNYENSVIRNTSF